MEALVPSFHKKVIKQYFCRVAETLHVKPAVARTLHRIATEDSSAASNQCTSAVDARIMEFVKTEDLEIFLDLRQLNSKPAIYDPFFDAAAMFIHNVIETAVDDRRHDCVTHLAVSMSAADLHR